MTNQFTWIPIYQELARELANWENRQSELIAFLEALRRDGFVITPLNDKDSTGARLLLTGIDPFTFFGVFNRRIGQEQRITILSRMRGFFKLKNDVPEDFNGIPILNNLKSWFISNQIYRKEDDITKLWKVFKLALDSNPLENKRFLTAFDDALSVRNTNVNLTMGLFWINPIAFLSLDQTNRIFLKIDLPASGVSAEFYARTIRQCLSNEKSFPEVSLEAWSRESKRKSMISETNNKYNNGINYWLVGAYWDDKDPADQTERFLAEGIWENGYQNKYLEDVKSMKVNDKIAIKAAGTQRKGLPFNNQNKTTSRMIIKAIGTIVANRNDGRTVEVEWETDFQEKAWYFYTNRSTLWHLRFDKEYKLRELSEKLRDFVWFGKEQDYEWFCKLWWGSDQITVSSKEVSETSKLPYGIEDIVISGIFLKETELKEILERLQAKKALILQGAPGVGKTFLARKLAYALMEEIDPERCETVQFHQSYSYDDFVRGYRPMPTQAGTFGLQNGVFYEFCQRAANDPDHEYVFIIDEINRGNLSQIFGELLMLIEHDKRGAEHSVPLVYRSKDEERFFIPSNLYLIGLMNLADRSLAMVDYALRRRFAFFTLQPQYESDLFRQWLLDREMNPRLVERIIKRMTTLNQKIKEDPLLGENYQIGHSFFCPKGENFNGLGEDWYQSIVRTEIVPLLKEYWFDNPKKAEDAERDLLAP